MFRETAAGTVEGDPHARLDLPQSWRRFIAPGHLTAPIRAHLDAERALMAGMLEGDVLEGEASAGGCRYGAVIEAGCADGSLLMRTVVNSGVDYLGIDIAAAAVDKTLSRLRTRPARPGQHVDVIAADARDLSGIDISSLHPKLLVAFPFNVFGIIAKPRRVLTAAAGIGADVLVLTYQATDRASEVRGEYFKRCGWAGTERVRTDGRHYTAGDLTSSVYSAATMRRWLTEAGFQAATQTYGEIGLAMHGRLTPTPTPATEP